MSISCISQKEDLRLYINGVLHVMFPFRHFQGMQSYYRDGGKQLHVIEIYLTSQIILLEYDQEDTWKSILECLNQNI